MYLTYSLLLRLRGLHDFVGIHEWKGDVVLVIVFARMVEADEVGVVSSTTLAFQQQG